MQEINFQHIRPYHGGPREAFEELCCQIYRRLPASELPHNSRYLRFRGAGGDGGVESIWILPDGQKWGIQSKYFVSLESSQFTQMKNSLQQAIKNHPELTRYIFCFPFNITGPVAGGTRGQSQQEKLDEWMQQRMQELAATGNNISIEYWAESELRDRLIAADQQGGLRRYWFDHEIMTIDWLRQRLDEAQSQAGKRYSPRLSVDVLAFEAMEAFAGTDTWRERVENLFASVRDEVERWHRHIGDPRDVPDACRGEVEVISEHLARLSSELNKATDIESDINWPQVIALVDRLLQDAARVEKVLLNALCDAHGEHADTPGFRQFQAEYMCAFPAAKLDAARDLLKCLNLVADWLNSSASKLPRSQCMLLRGTAGVGKTHAIMDHAIHRREKDQICLIFFGEDFDGDEPWRIIAHKLGLAGNISRDELWGMINTAAEGTGQRAVLYIDALNESQERQRWKQSWLPTLRQQISQYAWLKLCVSCRDTYLDEVIDDEAQWPWFEHNGFVGREFDAIRQFFAFYQLQPPATPLMQREFANPLFLHLVCQGLQGARLSSIPLGSFGFLDVLGLFLEEKNQRTAQVCRYDPHEDKVSRAVTALAKQMATHNTRLLALEEAKATVDAIYPVSDYNRSLFRQLEKEGLIAFVERRSRPLGPRSWDCRFTFERVADFLIAGAHLEGLEASTVQSAFMTGKLAFAVHSAEVAQSHRGVLEAWSMILPERFGIELADVVPQVDRHLVLSLIFAGFQWRSAESFSAQTTRITLEGLSHHESYSDATDALIGIAVIPEHPLNANFIHTLLNQDDLTTRDPFWCPSLYEDFEKHGAAWRLIEWALKADLTSFNEETVRLWAVMLGWFCAASDRRVRDRATKGLTRLFLAMPSIIQRVLSQFTDVDDDYVLERISLAAYSAMLRSDDGVVLRELAASIYENIFAQNNVPLNALIRDWLRLILELARQRDLLHQNIDPTCFRPPYQGPWPIIWPSEEDVAHLARQEAFQGEMALSSYGGIGTDFARYILGPRIQQTYDLATAGITTEHIHRWFIKSAAELGYPGHEDRCFNYDRYLLSIYGGGRSKPVWAERLGKKYYWILLQRLAGIIGDHVPKRISPWSSNHVTSCPSLQAIDLRDIDPTDLRAYSPEPQANLTWWKPIHYDFDVEQTDHAKWIALEDFANIVEVLFIADNNDEQWFHVELLYRLRQGVSSQPHRKYPYRDLRTSLTVVTISSSEVSSLVKTIQEEKFTYTQYYSHDDQLLIGEYPHTLACEQRFETQELVLSCELPGTDSAQMTMIELLRGAEFEYDCSQDERAERLMVPAPDLINFGKLHWDSHASWYDASGVVQAVAIDSGESSGLLVRLSYLHDYLTAHALVLVCIGCQEKHLITDSTDRPGFHEVRTVHMFDGKNIKLLHKSSTSEV